MITYDRSNVGYRQSWIEEESTLKLPSYAVGPTDLDIEESLELSSHHDDSYEAHHTKYLQYYEDYTGYWS
jgi:hypothetical protein